MLDTLALKALYTILTFFFVIVMSISLYTFRDGIIQFFTNIIDTIKIVLNFLFGVFHSNENGMGSKKGIFREWPFKSLFLFFGFGIVGLFIYLNQTNQLNTNAKYLSYIIGLLVLMLFSYLLYDNVLVDNNENGIFKNKYSQDKSFLDKLKFPIFDRFKPLIMNYGMGILLILAVYSIFIITIYNIDPRTFNVAKVINIIIAITVVSGLYYFMGHFLPLLGSFGRLLMYTIFLIPCVIHSVIKIMIRNEAKELGSLGKNLIILCIALILGAGYIFIPHLVRYIHSQNDIDSSRKDNIRLEIEALENKINLLKAKKNKIKGTPHRYIDWNYVSIGNKLLYEKKNEAELKLYLKQQKYLDENKNDAELKNEREAKELLGITVLSLDQATNYVQENVPKLFKIDSRIDEYTQRIKELKQEKSELGTTNKAKIILMKPMGLDNEIILSRGEDLNKATNVHPNLNYAISSWIYLHPEPPSHNFAINKDTNIIQYGEAQKIDYNMKDQTLKIKTYDRGENKWVSIYETTKIKLQKWNNIVLNVNNSTIDIFINKDLVISKINHLPILDGTFLISGERDGLSGGIANVVFYPSPLKKFKIDLLYNDLKNKSPPIV